MKSGKLLISHSINQLTPALLHGGLLLLTIVIVAAEARVYQITTLPPRRGRARRHTAETRPEVRDMLKICSLGRYTRYSLRIYISRYQYQVPGVILVDACNLLH